MALPGSDQKLYKEGIEAADDADIEAIMDLLYAYFEENKATVPELADVAKQTDDGNGFDQDRIVENSRVYKH